MRQKRDKLCKLMEGRNTQTFVFVLMALLVKYIAISDALNQPAKEAGKVFFLGAGELMGRAGVRFYL